jgi:hypothetical protein
LIREKPWRPADYWPQPVYVPPLPGTDCAFEAPAEERIGEGVRDPRHRRRSAPARTAWRIITWTFTCGLVAGIIMTVLAVFILHVA